MTTAAPGSVSTNLGTCKRGKEKMIMLYFPKPIQMLLVLKVLQLFGYLFYEFSFCESVVPIKQGKVKLSFFT